MDPMYQSMQSHPCQKDQMHYGPHYYPGAEAFPAHMYANLPRPPVNYESWPCSSNYGYPYPMACHGCCNHSYFPPHYAWRSPYSHVPPVPYPGSYPPYPIQSIPAPSYAMRQPQYEYEKNMPRDHQCCGCPNHQFHQKEQKSVRIEEEEPDGETKMKDSQAPFRFKNYPYPIVWLPGNYSKNEEPRKSGDSKYKDLRDGSVDDAKPKENQKAVQARPDVGNGWWPFVLNNLGSSKKMGDREEKLEQSDNGKGQGSFPFPIVWMPYKPEEKEQKEKSTSTRPSLEMAKRSDGERKINANEEQTGGQAFSVVKDIPVQGVEQKESSRSKENESNAPSGKSIDNGERKASTSGEKRKSSSPPKSSKLPPVCLRVDPLPRRKSANGSSRSPSPPGVKQKQDHVFTEANNVKANDNTKTTNNADKGITKTIEVVDGKSGQEEVSQVNCHGNCKGDVPKSLTVENPSEERNDQSQSEANIGSEAREEREVQKAKEMQEEKMEEPTERKISEEEAAIIIQSAYRGFDVRRWEPVKKLKQIAKVREQIAEVKQQLEAVELSSDIQGSSKQRSVISETIMSLLLKLDSIQGLDPSIREVRKSLVRELMSLQEKLDSISKEKSEISRGNDSIVRSDEDATKETLDTSSLDNGNEIQPELVEPIQNQLNEGSNSNDLEIPVTNSVEEVAGEKFEKEASQSSESCTIKESESSSQLLTENKDEQSNVGLLSRQSPAEVTDIPSTDEDGPGSELAELPQGVLDDDAQVLEDNKQFDSNQSEADQPKQVEEGQKEADATSEAINDISMEENGENVETSELTNDVSNGENKVKLEGENLIDIPLDESYVESDAKEPSLINGSESYESKDMFEHSEDCGKRELPRAESFNGKDATTDELCEDCGMSNVKDSSILEEAQDKLSEKESNLDQETRIIDESAETCKAGQDSSHSDKSLAQQSEIVIAEDIKDHEATFEEAEEPQILLSSQTENEGTEEDISKPMEVLTQELEQKGDLGNENLEARGSETSNGEHEKISPHVDFNRMDTKLAETENESSPSCDGLKESNEKLIEENERLREMMEKLIKTGQEQLNAISSLSGRVKDLEKKLSRKKKLKMKRYREPKLCMLPSSYSSLKDGATWEVM